MTNALDAIRAELTELRDTIAGAAARIAQIEPEIHDLQVAIAALEDERDQLAIDARGATDRITALERAEAVLIEHSTPVLAAPNPEPAPEPEPVSPARERIRRELRDATSHAQGPAPEHKPAATPRPRRERATPIDAKGRQRRTDAGTVLTRNTEGGFRAPKRRYAQAHTLAPQDVVVTREYPLDQERAAIVLELLVDRGGQASQHELAADLAEVLDITKLATARRIVSLAVHILYRDRLIDPTGDAADDRSHIWRLRADDA